MPEMAHGKVVLLARGVASWQQFGGYFKALLIMWQLEVNNVKHQGGKMTQKKGDLDGEYRNVSLEKIDEPEGRVRLDISDEMVEELGENIREQGLFNAILVRQKGKRFEIIAGHRRYLAYKYLQYKAIPCKISKMDDLTVALARAAENIFREDISPIEEGAIYLDLQESHGLNYDQISKRMKKPPSRIKRRMDLTNMPGCLQKAIHSKKISTSVGEALWRLGVESEIEYFLSFAIENGATFEVVTQWVRDHQRKKRLPEENVIGGDSLMNPNEPTKHYAPCDICQDAMEVGTETAFRACRVCTDRIREAIKP